MMSSRKSCTYQCTAKAAEGCAAENALGFTKDDGMHIEMHWQDSDSSTTSSSCDHFLIEQKPKLCYLVVMCWASDLL